MWTTDSGRWVSDCARNSGYSGNCASRSACTGCHPNLKSVPLSTPIERCRSARYAVRREANQEVQRDFVIVKVVEFEEVFDEPEQADDVDVGRELFLHLARDGLFCRLAMFRPAAGERPERVVVGAVQQHGAIVDGHAGDTVIEPPRSLVEPDHRRDTVPHGWAYYSACATRS